MIGATVIADVLAETTSRMTRAVEAAKEDFATVRTGRANPQMFQKVLVDYYGSPTPLAQLASLANPEARSLIITPYDKSALKAIEQAIRDMPNLGANPTNDGNIVRVTMPELTEERRKEYVKLVRSKGEDAKVRSRTRSARTRSHAARRSWMLSPASTSTSSTTRSSAKRPSSSRSERA
jgi:ribosome recycling factor